MATKHQHTLLMRNPPVASTDLSANRISSQLLWSSDASSATTRTRLRPRQGSHRLPHRSCENISPAPANFLPASSPARQALNTTARIPDKDRYENVHAACARRLPEERQTSGSRPAGV